MTNRVVVVADNRSLSMGLTGLGYDVVDLRPDQLDGWLAATPDADGLVVGVDGPEQTRDIVVAVNDRLPAIRVLVVTPQDEPLGPLSAAPSVAEIVRLPVTRLSLAGAVSRLLAPLPQTVQVPAAEPIELDEPAIPTPRDEPAEPPTMRIAPVEPAARIEPAEPPPRIVGARSTDALRERLAGRHVNAAPFTVATTAPAANDVEVETRLEPAPADAAAGRRDTGDSAAVTSVGTPTLAQPETALRRQDRQLADLVHGLLARAHQLNDVRDVAHAVVEEAANATGATYGVAMLPDGELWRVCGAVGIRPLEWRYVVEPDSWLVTTVIDGERGVVIEDSDIARQRLGGAPLAHHRHIIVSPITGPAGMILLAREEQPFSEDDLQTLAAIAQDAGPALSEALLVRSLARALQDFCGDD